MQYVMLNLLISFSPSSSLISFRINLSDSLFFSLLCGLFYISAVLMPVQFAGAGSILSLSNGLLFHGAPLIGHFF